MDLKTMARLVAKKAAKRSPEILTGLGIAGFAATIVMTAKASPKVKEIHEREKFLRSQTGDAFSEEGKMMEKQMRRESYKAEAIELLPLCGPPAAMGAMSITCFLFAHKIEIDRKAAVMAAYSLSEKTLSAYQQKVIDKLGEDVHHEILDEATKDIARNEVPDSLDPEKIVVPEGMVRVYDNVTGRYFFSSKEKIMMAESAVNKRLLAETRVPLQELYYELGLEESFHLGEVMGWDISSPYMESTLNIWFTPMLDDDKNPCLALNYHVLIFERAV